MILGHDRQQNATYRAPHLGRPIDAAGNFSSLKLSLALLIHPDPQHTIRKSKPGRFCAPHPGPDIVSPLVSMADGRLATLSPDEISPFNARLWVGFAVACGFDRTRQAREVLPSQKISHFVALQKRDLH